MSFFPGLGSKKTRVHRRTAIRLEPLEERRLLATITVNGAVKWTDSAGGTHGLPSAFVEVRDADLLDSDVAATTTTDPAGNYSVTFTFDDGLLQGDPDLFVRVYARSNVADIKPDGAAGETYFLDSSTHDEVADGTTLSGVDITANNTDDGNTVFSVHHALVMIGRYAGTLAGAMPSQIDVRFPTTRHTSLFSFSAGQLHILQLDRWDWDVIHHEYGHYVQNVHAFQANPGGAHGFDDNLSSTRGSKSVGLPLAWGEGWPTFFGTAGQQSSGASALGIPNVGDTTYSDTEDAIPPTNRNLETENGKGEDNELSVMAALWDMYDAAADGEDRLSLSDATLFSRFKSAGATTVGAAWDAVAGSLSTKEKVKLGALMGQSNISPVLLEPADHFTPDAATPATFKWRRNGGGTPNPLNDFRIRFYKQDYSSVIFEKELGDVEEWTPDATEWSTILAGDAVVHWVIEGKNTSAPESPGGTLERYWSGSRELGGVSIVFVIDDTGSMGEEIEAVKSALQSFIDNVEAGLPPGTTAPTIEVITFKDSVTRRVTSKDLNVVRGVVASLFASGGGDCPEFSAQGLAAAAEDIAPGGTILLATDASTQPGVDLGSVISSLRARSVTVNTILSGDCSGISSLSEMGDQGESLQGAFEAASDVPQELQTRRSSFVGGSSSLKPGSDSDDNGPQAPIVDAGQPVIDDHGDTPSSATRLIAGAPFLMGLIGGTDSVDVFRVALTKDKQVAIKVGDGTSGGLNYEILGTDGTTSLAFGLALPLRPGVFVPAEDGEYFLKVLSGGSQRVYQLAVVEDPFAGLVSSIDVFSTVSTQTGGSFVVRDDVNFGSSEEYESALLNILNSTIAPAVLSANPDKSPAGQEIGITLTGRNTNWRQGATTVAFTGLGLNVVSVDVQSATSLTVTVQIAADAALGFRDVQVSSTLGAGEEIASGVGVLEVLEPTDETQILSVEPGNLFRGVTGNVLIRGLGTTWDATTTISLGADVTVNSVQVLSPTLLNVNVTVGALADIGFRTAQATTPGQPVLSRPRAIFIGLGQLNVAGVVSIDPSTAEQGTTVEVLVTGFNTHFAAGSTTADFGAGITVKNVEVIDATHANVSITVAPDAAFGFRSVSMTTGDEVAVLISGFFVGGKDELPTERPLTGTPLGQFLEALYQDVLGRSVDTVGLTGWSERLGIGLPRLTMVNGVLLSPEYRTKALQDLYQTLLQRVPSEGEVHSWSGYTHGSVRTNDVVRAFLGSAEYFARNGGQNEQFVSALYRDVLGRASSPEEVSFWVNALAAHSRVTVAGLFLQSLENRQQLVEEWYQNYLGRPTDSGGLAFWSQALVEPSTPEIVQAALLASPEYYDTATFDGLALPGRVGTTIDVSFALQGSALTNSEVGVFVADDASGRVNGVAPDASGYAQAVLTSTSRQTLSLQAAPPDRAGGVQWDPVVLGLPAGRFVGLYLIPSGTAQQILATNPANQAAGNPKMLFSLPAANPDSLTHVAWRSFDKFGFEDQFGGGDRDFDDVVGTVAFGVDSSGAAGVRALANDSAIGELLAAQTNAVANGRSKRR